MKNKLISGLMFLTGWIGVLGMAGATETGRGFIPSLLMTVISICYFRFWWGKESMNEKKNHVDSNDASYPACLRKGA